MTIEFSAMPSIRIDGSELGEEALTLVERVVVDDHLHLPDTFAITLRDPDGSVLSDVGGKVGATIRIGGSAIGEDDEKPLLVGEVTALEGDYEPDGARVTIRGYDLSHRLQGGRRVTTFRDMTDSDVSRTVAQKAGVAAGNIESSSVRHEHLSQVDISDWDFLRARAREIGHEVAVVDGKLDFRRPVDAARAPSEGDYETSDPLQLVLNDNLQTFYPRITAAEQVQEVEVRGWDQFQKRAVVGTAPAVTTSAQLSQKPAELAQMVGRDRWVSTMRPLSTQRAADEAARADAEQIASGFAEADGVADGNPELKAGVAVNISGVSAEFAGRYTLSQSRHIFDAAGYRTQLVVSGRQDRTLLGLTSPAAATGGGSGRQITGLTVALVTDNADPDELGRVKLKFPTLDETYESDWARVVQLGAGPGGRGFVMLPEVNDEVLVGFEAGDIRRPFVLGGLYNGQDKPDLGDGLFDAGAVRRRGFISSEGHSLIFLDDSSKSGISLMTGDRRLRVALDGTEAQIRVNSAGDVSINAGGALTLEAGGELSLKSGTSLSIESGTELKIKGGAKVDIDGPMIELN